MTYENVLEKYEIRTTGKTVCFDIHQNVFAYAVLKPQKQFYGYAWERAFANKVRWRVSRSESESERIFKQLAEKWKLETKGASSSTVKFLNDNHLKIIGMGEKALPYIFKDLKENGGHWFVALDSITQVDPNPVPEEHYGIISKMREDWLRWAEDYGYEF